MNIFSRIQYVTSVRSLWSVFLKNNSYVQTIRELRA